MSGDIKIYVKEISSLIKQDLYDFFYNKVGIDEVICNIALKGLDKIEVLTTDDIKKRRYYYKEKSKSLITRLEDIIESNSKNLGFFRDLYDMVKYYNLRRDVESDLTIPSLREYKYGSIKLAKKLQDI